MPKSLTITMPTFNGKSDKFELFEDLFQTSLKIHNQLTEDDRINYLSSLVKGDALQTFNNINGPTREFRRKYGSFPREVRKTPIDGKIETPISQNCFQSNKSKVSKFSWLTSKTGRRRIRNSCPCHHRFIHICQNATTPEDINKSGPSGQWHSWANCHTTGNEMRVNWFGSSWRAINGHCEPTCHKH